MFATVSQSRSSYYQHCCLTGRNKGTVTCPRSLALVVRAGNWSLAVRLESPMLLTTLTCFWDQKWTPSWPLSAFTLGCWQHRHPACPEMQLALLLLTLMASVPSGSSGWELWTHFIDFPFWSLHICQPVSGLIQRPPSVSLFPVSFWSETRTFQNPFLTLHTEWRPVDPSMFSTSFPEDLHHHSLNAMLFTQSTFALSWLFFFFF